MRIWHEKLAVAGALASSLPLAFFSIAATAERCATPPPAWLASRVDELIPVVPVAAWVYASWYVAPMLLAFFDIASFRRAGVALAASFIACAIGYLQFPVRIVRPDLDPHAGLSTTLLQTIYLWDPPVNLFPSFHAGVAAVLFWLCPWTAAGGLGVRVWMVVICVSCVLTKQHYVLDVVAGFAVGTTAAVSAAVSTARLRGRWARVAWE